MKIITIYIIFIITFQFLYNNKEIKIKNIENINRRIYSLNRGLDKIFFDKNLNIYINIIPINIKKNINILFNTLTILSKLKISLFLKSNNIYNKNNYFNKKYKKKIINTYIILPILGPGTIKTHLILLLEEAFKPVIFLTKNKFLYYFFYIINKKSLLIYDINFFHNSITDGYSFLKDIFIQNNIKK